MLRPRMVIHAVNGSTGSGEEEEQEIKASLGYMDLRAEGRDNPM